jgi:hypothetical protein
VTDVEFDALSRNRESIVAALPGTEHLTLLVGKESIALALIRHFGSLAAQSLASFQELHQFLPPLKAETVAAALSVWPVRAAIACHCGELVEHRRLAAGPAPRSR